MKDKYVTHDGLVQYVLKNKTNTYTNKPEAIRAINSVVRAIYDAILENDKVVLKNVCVIDKKHWKPRLVRDRDSLEPVLKDECYTVGFSVNQTLLKMVNKTLKGKEKLEAKPKPETVIDKEVENDNQQSQSRSTEEATGEARQPEKVKQDSKPRSTKKKSRKTSKTRRRK